MRKEKFWVNKDGMQRPFNPAIDSLEDFDSVTVRQTMKIEEAKKKYPEIFKKETQL